METFFQITISCLNSYFFGYGILFCSLFLLGQSRKIELINTSFRIIPVLGLLLLFLTLFNWFLEFFRAYYSGTEYEQHSFIGYAAIYGSFWYTFFASLLYAIIPTQLFWFKKIKNSRLIVFFISLLFIICFERILIFISSFHRDYLPSSWIMYTGDVVLNVIYSIVIFVITTLIYRYKNNILQFIKLK